VSVTRNRCIPVELEVRTKFVVILFVGFEQMTKMLFVEDDDVIRIRTVTSAPLGFW
jgi:hypothetical protein